MKMTEGWSDQRVNQLKKLWQQGKSASEIAETLGGVTRNAVIGKAHRLGLSGRPSPIKKPASPAKKAAGKASPAAKTPATKTVAPKPVSKPVAKPVASKTEALKTPVATKAAPVKADHKAIAAPAAKKKETSGVTKTPFNPPLTQEAMARPLMVHDGEVISILELNERTCRWPIGDPKDPAFGYCGAASHPGFPYCAGHVAMAFQSSRKDNRKAVADHKDEDEDDIEDVDIEDVDTDSDIVDESLEDETDEDIDLEV
jgi:GcrA cell cycle regulator